MAEYQPKFNSGAYLDYSPPIKDLLNKVYYCSRFGEDLNAHSQSGRYTEDDLTVRRMMMFETFGAAHYYTQEDIFKHGIAAINLDDNSDLFPNLKERQHRSMFDFGIFVMASLRSPNQYENIIHLGNPEPLSVYEYRTGWIRHFTQRATSFFNNNQNYKNEVLSLGLDEERARLVSHYWRNLNNLTHREIFDTAIQLTLMESLLEPDNEVAIQELYQMYNLFFEHSSKKTVQSRDDEFWMQQLGFIADEFMQLAGAKPAQLDLIDLGEELDFLNAELPEEFRGVNSDPHLLDGEIKIVKK